MVSGMKPLVSILIAAYNAEDCLAETLRSAIAQTWERKEIIVVDDGSTDNTPLIARRFESNGVRVVRQENEGHCSAKNKALSLSQGDYIQWLDADDLLAPDKIAKQLGALEQGGSKRTLLSAAWARFLFRHHQAVFMPNALWNDMSQADFLIAKLGHNLFMPSHAWLVSRELNEAAGFLNPTLIADDDGEYFCRVLMASDGIHFVPDAKVYYRVSGNGSVSYIGGSDRKLDSQWRSMQLHIGYLRSLEDSERARAASVRYLQTWLIYFYPERWDIVAQAEQLAKDLGGQLQVPRLSWKYSWIRTVFGWRLAKHAQRVLPSARLSLKRSSEKVFFFLRRGKTASELNRGTPSASASGPS